MAEYIDREKMLKYLEENNTADEWIVGQYNADWIYSFIESQPTADVVEVKHGKWIVNARCNHKPSRYKNPEKWVTYKCSECGYSNGRKKSNFCPNCGAKMDGRRDT